jgi:hypothetical protein
MEAFDHILNWRLKAGSHRFPGPDGGTCINEAALVAAGFEYRPIHSVSQMPRCFSRPICRLAMLLNDGASDEERQLLLPFVTRLACADTREIERKREAYIGARLPMAQLVMGKVSIETGVEVLEGALAIGRRADPLAPEVARTRMDAARSEATDVSLVRDDTLFGKVKAWFTAAKVPEPAD